MSASYNKVLLMGNLTRDPELKYTPKGTAVTDIGLACNRVYQTESGEKREEVTFVDITVMGRQAETVSQYCQKGRPVFVEGRLQLDQWDDKQTGQKRSKLKVMAERVQFLGSGQDRPGGAAGGPRRGGDEEGGGGYEEEDGGAPRPMSRPAPAQRPAQQSRPAPARRPEPSAEDDDIPF